VTRRVTRAALGVLALAVALAHIGFLPATLEDIDSVNFALGVRDFDVAKHRPHPPGYPVYIGLGKVAVTAARPFSGHAAQSAIEARTLAVLSLIAAVLSIPLLYRTLACWSSTPADSETADPPAPDAPWHGLDIGAIAATALAIACPLSWYLAIRPMSDAPGLAAAFAAQAALSLAWWRQRPRNGGDRRMTPDMAAASGRMIVLGALLSALAIGFRTQNAMLTIPFLGGVLLDRIGRGFAPALFGSAVAFVIGCLLWVVPLIVASGGLDAYLAALGVQAGEDFAGGEMLYLNPAPRLVAYALQRTFIYPWDSFVLGGVICALAALGGLMLLMRDRRTFVAVSLVAVPYLVFHLLFQDTSYVRYALPLIAPVAFLVIRGVEGVAPRIVLPAAALLTIWSVVIASPVAAAYGSQASPTAQAVAAMEERRASSLPGALGMHQTYQRPLEAEALDIQPRLPAPPRREWLELVRYWRDGETRPLWFLADPRRSDLALIDPQSRRDRSDFGWRFTSLSQIGGMRPAAVSWLRLPAPGWFAEEGWALTPETAGMARLVGRGPSIAPITAWVRRRPDAVHVIIGGRHLGSAEDPPVQFTAAIDDSEIARWDATPGFFVHEFDLPAGALAGDGLARLTVGSRSADGRQITTAIEQFDLQTRGTLMWAFDDGWHEPEYDPSVGVWRWTSEAATLRVAEARSPVAVTLRVEPPRHYFDDDPAVRVTAGDRTIGETDFRTPLWSVIVPLDALQTAGGRVTIRTNRTFVPRERQGNADQRHLGLRVLSIDITSQP
jgi:hypothetical protein